MSHTYALLEVSPSSYEEIKAKLLDAGYGHAINDLGEIDMHGIALCTKEEEIMPKESTEKGIGWAIHRLQGGGKARRPGWNETAFIHITGTPGSTAPSIMLVCDGEVVPYLPIYPDLLARDWEPVE